MAYDYLEAVKDNVKDYIDNEIDLDEYRGRKDELEEYLNDELWTEDSVTGNGSGSYTFNRAKAAEYLMSNLDLLAEAVEEFGGNLDVLKDGAEACDVTIRCYLLGQAISEVLDDYEEELKESLKEGKDLTKVKGTISKVLQDNIDDIYRLKTANEIKDFVEKLFKENNISTPKSKSFIDKLSRKRDTMDSISTILNTILAGSDNKSIDKRMNSGLDKKPIKYFAKKKMNEEEKEFKPGIKGLKHI